MSDTVTLTINGIEVEVPRGELIVESVKRLGLEIPIFCYHPRMKPVGMCRMCLVDVGFKQQDGTVKMMPKPQAGCTLPADANMVVYTDTENVRRDRKGVLEFLLINHPLDCPICDRGGECPLQNNTLFYGPSTSRYVEVKRHLPKAFPLSKYITLDLERCIQCGRCVRFTEEISGDAQLAFLFRGAQMTPQTFELTDFDSKFSGNVIEICPVGALTNSKYRFRARPWDLETRPSVCMECSNGCATWMDYRVDKVARINGRTNELINEEWTCDRGKFGHEWVNAPDRLTKVMLRKGDVLAEGSWSDAFGEIIAKFGSDSAGLAGHRPSNEDYFLWGNLLMGSFGSNQLDIRWEAHAPTADGFQCKTSISDLENAKHIVLFGGNLADDQPIVYLRVRKAATRNGARITVVSTHATDADAFADEVIRFEYGSELDAATRLNASADSVIIASRSLLNSSDGSAAAIALDGKGTLNLLTTGANEAGAFLLGMNQSSTRSILEGCRDGKIRALWLLQCDPFQLWHDRELVQAAIENVEFLVVQDTNRTEVFEYASVVLPAAAFCERAGTYTNCEGRVQALAPIMAPRGASKAAWKVFAELLMRAKPGAPMYNVREVYEAIREHVPAFAARDPLVHSSDEFPVEALAATGTRGYAKI
ncbi:MAG: NADH-quinone oxidoreductase subunit NuoG [Armatimonadota bacterium]|nr:NADH-quinone oxidoreductase subunit NuoG [Armatimonadota bacterium]